MCALRNIVMKSYICLVVILSGVDFCLDCFATAHKLCLLILLYPLRCQGRNPRLHMYANLIEFFGQFDLVFDKFKTEGILNFPESSSYECTLPSTNFKTVTCNEDFYSLPDSPSPDIELFS